MKKEVFMWMVSLVMLVASIWTFNETLNEQKKFDKKKESADFWHAQYHEKIKELQTIDLFLCSGFIPPKYQEKYYANSCADIDIRPRGSAHIN